MPWCWNAEDERLERGRNSLRRMDEGDADVVGVRDAMAGRRGLTDDDGVIADGERCRNVERLVRA